MKKSGKKGRITLLIAVGMLIFGVVIGNFFVPSHYVFRNAKHHLIYPSIYICGSSGYASSMNKMIDAMTSDPVTKAHKGLTIVVNTDNSLKITGKIADYTDRPTIAVGMQKGTNNSLKYESALRAVMGYLSKHYRVGYVNFMGYSAGGAGAYRYLLQYSFDRKLPPVKKFLALAGQFNASTAQPNQTLDDVLKVGPKNKTKYYKYWVANYKRLNPAVQVVLLAGDYDAKKQSDGIVPWADSFSLNYLLQKNGNPVEHYLIQGGGSRYHTNMPKNTEAINYVKVFFYE